jgi:hypothetical protein
MPFAYGLYPWTWNTPSGGMFGYHSPPTGASAVLDFRPLGEQAKQLQSGGYGFFAWGDPAAIPGDAVALGVGDCRTIQPTTAQRNAMRTTLGLASNPTGAFLADCLASILGELADPTGASGPKPLMPQTDGVEVIQLGGHSPVWSRAYNPALTLSANPTGRANRQRDVFRANMQIAFDVGGVQLLAKALGAALLQHGYQREEVKQGAGNKQGEWRQLLPSRLSSQVGGAFRPVLPTTSFSETWPNTSNPASTAQGRTWEYCNANGFTSGQHLVTGNTLRISGAFAHELATCLSAVSSDNHYAEVLVTAAAGLGFGSATCRNASGAATCYFGGWQFIQAHRLHKVVAGSFTQLATQTELSAPTAKAYTCKANGSTISSATSGLSDLSVTDTTITGNPYGGVELFRDGGSETSVQAGAWSIDDGLAPAPVAAFTGTPLSGTSPLSVAFDSSATTNTPTTHLWERKLGAGAWENFAGTPTVANPTEAFTAGTWSVRYTATNAGGSNTKTETDYVTVTAAAGGKSLAGSHSLDIWRGLGL